MARMTSERVVAAGASVAARFFAGAMMLPKGAKLVLQHPKLALLGLVPAAIVGAVLLAALIFLATQLAPLSAWLNPVPQAWGEPWWTLTQVVIALAIFAAAVALAAVVFTGSSLALGEPVYERIWQAIERDLGGKVPEHGVSFGRALVDAFALIGLGLLTSIGMLIVGAIPLIGGAVAAVVGFALTGSLLARELLTRPMEARGIDASGRRGVLRTFRAETVGFGVATQLCFLIPAGAILVMPAAVAGATLLGRRMLGESETPSIDEPAAT